MARFPLKGRGPLLIPKGATGGGSAGVATFNTRTGAVVLSKADVTGTGLAAVDVGADAAGAATAVKALPLGLTGAVAATRYVGGTASGAPVTGTFAAGDYAIDLTGKVWVCTVAGTPGTWANVGASAGVSTFNSRTGAVVAKVTIGHTWAVTGAIAAESGPTDVTNYLERFSVPLSAAQTAQVTGYRCSIGGGTSATVKVTKNGTDLTGFTGIVVTTTRTTATPAAQSLAANDDMKLVVTAISVAPVNLSFTLFIEHTI